jgi:hypothetical protein
MHGWIGLPQPKDPAVRPGGAATGAGQADAPDAAGAEPQAT